LVRGLYTAATGARVAQANVDVIANNLANVNTAGFKRSLLQVEASAQTQLYRNQTDPGRLPSALTNGVPTHEAIGGLGSGAHIFDTPAIFDQGALQATGNSLDVALQGTGFFAVRTPQGQLAYTRDGSFLRTAQNQLVTTSGAAVLDAQGNPISIPAQGEVQISRTGAITSAGVPVAQLGLFQFANPNNLRPQGANTFVDAGAIPQAAAQTTVLQGSIEKSNADVVGSMVDLITNERWFDVNENMIQQQDQLTSLAVGTIGRSTT
jgi:flagellar basal-body rod protein FlgF